MVYNIEIMGVITIEVPQKIKKSYKIPSEKSASHIIHELEKHTDKTKKVDLSDVIGIWADRAGSAEDIARELRAKSNSRRTNG
jgi:hypothetical protein